MRTVVIVIVIAATLMAVGCGDTENLENQLATANTQVNTLDSALTATQSTLSLMVRRADSLQDVVQAEHAAFDSVSSSLKSAFARAGRAEQNLHAQRRRYETTIDSLNGINDMNQEQISNLLAQVQNGEAQVALLQEDNNGLTRQRDSVYAFMDRVQPWYDYYKHESQRNWLKKLFGAGNAGKPEVTEPEFNSTPPPVDLEAHRP